MTELPSGTVTFLFTDLVGSTRLWEGHPDATQEALARHDELLRAAIEALRQALTGSHNTGQRPLLFRSLDEGVSVATDLGAWELAATLNGALRNGPPGLWMAAGATERAAREAARNQARGQLGRDRYDRALAMGAAMSDEQVVAYTLAELDRLLANNDWSERA